MKIIIVSSPENSLKEADHIQHLFNSGLETLHLRKPDQSEAELEETLKTLPPSLYKRIVIHSHYKLLEKYNLKGIHLTERFMQKLSQKELKELITIARSRGLSISGSFHSIEDLDNLQLKLDYVFLGPVFNSLSKSGYQSKINLEDATDYLNNRKGKFDVVAIGGIDESNIATVKACGFDGVALLGSIWNDNSPADKFKLLNKLVSDAT